MAKQSTNARVASYLDVERLLGPLDADILMSVIALRPTIQDLEKSALHVSGEGDTLPEPHQPHGTVLAIIELITKDDEDERRAR